MKTYSKKNIGTGSLYFGVHFVVELVSFAILTKQMATVYALFTVLLFDGLAFIPQGLLGRFFELHKKIKMGYIGNVIKLSR